MALNASKVKMSGGGKKHPPIETGNYLARIVQVLDLGLQPQRPYQGQEKPPAHEIMLTYELGSEFLKDDDGNDMEDKPRWISETFPLRSLKSDLAKSTKRLGALDPQGVLQGDFAQLVGTTCTVTVVQNPKKDDPSTIYNNVGNITPPMKGIPVPELVNPPKVFDMDEPDLEILGSLPEWLQEKIKGNLNYQGSPLQKALSGAGSAPAEAPAEDAKEETNDNPW